VFAVSAEDEAVVRLVWPTTVNAPFDVKLDDEALASVVLPFTVRAPVTSALPEAEILVVDALVSVV
jgi:hypothetical protein